jgi:hypothetical protein
MKIDVNLPQVPQNLRGTYADDLNWKLQQVLRNMAAQVEMMTGSTFDGPHPVLGAYHLWIDATGDLRIKSSVPTTDLDGTVIGTQT